MARIGLFAAAVLAYAISGADAHRLRPEQVIAELRGAPLAEAYGITEVTRHPSLPRLLVIRVGPRWFELEPSKRRGAAKKWMSRWRDTVPQGIIAVLEQGTDRSLVNFDVHGRPVLTDQKGQVVPPDRDPKRSREAGCEGADSDTAPR